jgi:hypothetical protein
VVYSPQGVLTTKATRSTKEKQIVREVMSSTPRFWYSLRSLLGLMTGVAVLCSAVAACSPDVRPLLVEAFMQTVSLGLAIVATFFGAVMMIDVVSWVRKRQLSVYSLWERVSLLIRSLWFWIAGGLALLAAVSLNLYSTNHFCDDPCGLQMGWPFWFYVPGSLGSYYLGNGSRICADVLVAIVIAIFLGFGFREGVRPIFANFRRLFQWMRIWPNEERR